LPTIAAVGGAAVGAGLNLALAADVRLVGPRAKFVARFLELGLHPGGGMTWMIQHAVGPQ
jgi:enoyl-CoA hydratase